jgi:hypothetical protein
MDTITSMVICVGVVKNSLRWIIKRMCSTAEYGSWINENKIRDRILPILGWWNTIGEDLSFLKGSLYYISCFSIHKSEQDETKIVQLHSKIWG